MRLIVLPGLDGTGRLLGEFSEAVRSFFSVVEVVRYPVDQVLGYCALESFVRERLPAETPFVLLGESFSGPLAISIAAGRLPNLRGVVLTTTFDRQPVPRLSRLSPLVAMAPVRWLPLSLLSWMLLGRWATPELKRVLGQALAEVSPAVLRRRARDTMRIDVRARVPHIRVPLLYLRGMSDRLLDAHAGPGIVREAKRGHLVDIQGPHLLLQAQVAQCAKVIGEFAVSLGAADLRN